MTTLVPRAPYSKEELEKLYPEDLKLQLVQVFLRHGSPHTDWPYCNVARRMIQMAASEKDLSSWNGFQWRRKMEAFGDKDEAVVAVGATGEIEGIWQVSFFHRVLRRDIVGNQHGELTDRGRETTFALGQRMRHLYVDQLGFMPKIKSDTEDMYLRATPIPRALESLQQAFWGMYPASARTQDFPPPVIVGRSVSDETLFPNEGNCRRFRQLARLFADRAAKRWNETEQMDYLNSLWSKWMPEASPRVGVDSHPRLSGINDTINATDAHGPATKLPAEFYDKKAREYTNDIAVDEWFAGYAESREYRKLGVGALMGDVVDRMVNAAVNGGWRSERSASASGTHPGQAIKFAMSGCHDTTLAAILGSVGAFDDRWPPFTSSIAVELFSRAADSTAESTPSTQSGLLSSLLSSTTTTPTTTDRTPLADLPASSRQTLQKHYVRIRYNDRPVRVPGCAAKPENHLPGDETFCTLAAFKEIVDKYTPRSWASECVQNLGEGLYGKGDMEKSVAGF
ncbi:putative acid phosphatase [Aspergillus clavatus NRRL 1]|uniref:Histidine acid phosphatase, putative n=1 Tax=Aspergillus clavatus (strain ATCC 1007 / CBS 513.65 / DSM 816 / NCTC 3887 / NRRL 1 / QM 1276 / 107) TaxID=344612 RepID=A1CNI5_ASPCL|nr:histidine acid phosphatase, putative [Aspergillus clavatus NRRL 1]EAW07206.1 histidine acid phosphatase, putative [Aspergillus clavatus NRRL 1]